MHEHIVEVVNDAKSGASKNTLLEAAENLAVWSVRNTTNKDGSRLRRRGLMLAEALINWADELYPDD